MGKITVLHITVWRPLGRPFETSLGDLVEVARGSMEYSAVTQPAPLPTIQPGTDSSMEAVQST